MASCRAQNDGKLSASKIPFLPREGTGSKPRDCRVKTHNFPVKFWQVGNKVSTLKPAKIIRVKSVSIPIYPYSAKGLENAYQARFQDGNGKRVRWASKSLKALTERCRDKARQMASSSVDLTTLTADQVALCKEVIRRGITFQDLERLNIAPEPVQLRTAVAEFLRAKAAAATGSERHFRNLTSHLKSFQESVGPKTLLCSITPMDVDKWVNTAVAAKTRKNKRSSLVNFMRWAKRKELLPDATTAAERSEPVRVERKRVKIWSASDLQLMLAHVRADYLPWVALQAFAGIRTAELFPEQRYNKGKDPLRWENIFLERENPFVEVPASCAKTGERRLVPVCLSLLAWLRSFAKASGPVCPAKSPSRRNHSEPTIIETLEAHVGPWKRNALRHSFGTYRTAQTKNMGEVSLEMGNSVEMVKRHYYEAVCGQEAEAWFSVGPDRVDRALALKTGS